MFISRAPRNEALAPYVEALWVQRGELTHGYEKLLPSGRMQVLVNLEADELCDYTLEGRRMHQTHGAALQGARVAPMLIDTAHQRYICGVSFAAGGAWPFLGVPASEVAGRVIDLSDLWGTCGRVLRERLLEAHHPRAQLEVLETALLERGTSFDRGSGDVRLACRLLESGARVGSVGDRLGLSPRRIINLFRTHVGMSPKVFARLARFQSLLRARQIEVPWVELAAANGFSDQAHMIKEFRVFAGSTPSNYRPRSHEAPHHVPLTNRQFSSIHGQKR
jgi:AraC-like DNA-binding protein